MSRDQRRCKAVWAEAYCPLAVRSKARTFTTVEDYQIMSRVLHAGKGKGLGGGCAAWCVSFLKRPTDHVSNRLQKKEYKMRVDGWQVRWGFARVGNML